MSVNFFVCLFKLKFTGFAQRQNYKMCPYTLDLTVCIYQQKQQINGLSYSSYIVHIYFTLIWHDCKNKSWY